MKYSSLQLDEEDGDDVDSVEIDLAVETGTEMTTSPSKQSRPRNQGRHLHYSRGEALSATKASPHHERWLLLASMCGFLLLVTALSLHNPESTKTTTTMMDANANSNSNAMMNAHTNNHVDNSSTPWSSMRGRPQSSSQAWDAQSQDDVDTDPCMRFPASCDERPLLDDEEELLPEDDDLLQEEWPAESQEEPGEEEEMADDEMAMYSVVPEEKGAVHQDSEDQALVARIEDENNGGH